MFFSFKRARPEGQEPFPDSWQSILMENVLLYRTLSEPEQARLREATRILVTSRNWEGCAGQVIDDEVRVTIAGQAAILLLGLGDYCFDGLRTILVYPGAFLGEFEDEDGHPLDVEIRLGLSVTDGPVVLSWWHARWAGRFLGRVNVVLHEFAHKLAELGVPQKGQPPLLDPALERRWDRVMESERQRLGEDADHGRPTLLDSYGAESPAEFFAVATETFFLQPGPMREQHPEVYDLLAAFYRQNPASRPVPAAVAALGKGAEEAYTRQVVLECTVALKHRPDYVDAYRQRAEARVALGDLEGAVADQTEVVRLARGREERAVALQERGELLYDADRLAEARRDFTEAIGLLPEYTAPYVSRARVHASQDRPDEALADLNEAIRLDPRDDEARIERAHLWFEAGDLVGALKDLDRAARLAPGDATIYQLRARVRLERGEIPEALADSAQAIRLAPDDEESQFVRAEVLERSRGRT